MLVVCDFETYYDKQYSLSKMTTEQYVRDSQFKVHGFGVKIDAGPTTYYPEGQLDGPLQWLRSNQDILFILCHNTRFDGAILSWHYGIRPRLWLDTLSMARAVFQHESGSLANLSKLCGLGEKGKELANFLGVRSLSSEQQEEMGRYCKNDVDLTYALFDKMKAGFPTNELRVIDQTIRLFTEPVLELAKAPLEAHLKELRQKKLLLLGTRDITSLRSNDQFADLLRAHGVDPPTKTSARTGKETYAFAKTDEGMLALLEHEDEEVQLLATARLGVKSSIEETRTEAFLGIAERGPLPIPLNYFGAQNTGRDSGSDKVNLQNLPRGGALRRSIVAPDGHILSVVDFSQIEARMLAWLAGQWDLVEAFAKKEDVYCKTATTIYNQEIVKKSHPLERQVGKVTILGAGYGMGGAKFGSYLASGPMGSPPILFTAADAERMGVPLAVDEETARKVTTKLKGDDLLAHAAIANYIISTYRETYAEIPKYWRLCDQMLHAMYRGLERQYGPIQTMENALLLPNGQRLVYRGLHKNDDDNWQYSGKRGEKQYLYGAKLCENIDQALSCIVMKEAAVAIGARFKVVMRVHDEVVCCVPEEQGQECFDFMMRVMTTPPKWAPELPIDAEGGLGKSYGDAK